MSDRRLRDLLDAALGRLPDGQVLVAFSGGLDSTVLLHALARSDAARARGVRAIHIDHSISERSGSWADHCRAFASAIGVDLIVRTVRVARHSGIGLEASARQARYGAIETLLSPGEIVALAHHRDDQAETVMLKLLRGAGPEGIGAMREVRRLGRGLAWRPLLAWPRGALRDYADHHQLRWIQDPSNSDSTIDRNYLRMHVMPHIARRWPEAEASIAQSATWARAAAEYIDQEAGHALERLRGDDPATLHFAHWLALPLALRDPVLRRWLRAAGLAEPTHFQAAELVRQLGEAAEDRQPCVRWPGTEVRRYRDLLYALKPLEFPPLDWTAQFSGPELALPTDLGSLQLVPTGAAAARPTLPEPLQVRFRRGGESLRLNSRGYTRELRDLLQEAKVPPWERGRLPLLFERGGALIAVAGLFVSETAAGLFDAASARLEWRGGAAAARSYVVNRDPGPQSGVAARTDDPRAIDLDRRLS